MLRAFGNPAAELPVAAEPAQRAWSVSSRPSRRPAEPGVSRFLEATPVLATRAIGAVPKSCPVGDLAGRGLIRSQLLVGDSQSRVAHSRGWMTHSVTRVTHSGAEPADFVRQLVDSITEWLRARAVSKILDGQRHLNGPGPHVHSRVCDLRRGGRFFTAGMAPVPQVARTTPW
jgi:hypothetical protein